VVDRTVGGERGERLGGEGEGSGGGGKLSGWGRELSGGGGFDERRGWWEGGGEVGSVEGERRGEGWF